MKNLLIRLVGPGFMKKLLTGLLILSGNIYAVDFSGNWNGNVKILQYDHSGRLTSTIKCQPSGFKIKQRELRNRFLVESRGTVCFYGNTMEIIGGGKSVYEMKNGVLTNSKFPQSDNGQITEKGFKVGYKTCSSDDCPYYSIIYDAALVDQHHMTLVQGGPLGPNYNELIVWDLYRH